jgi:hypothetical protein
MVAIKCLRRDRQEVEWRGGRCRLLTPKETIAPGRKGSPVDGRASDYVRKGPTDRLYAWRRSAPILRRAIDRVASVLFMIAGCPSGVRLMKVSLPFGSFTPCSPLNLLHVPWPTVRRPCRHLRAVPVHPGLASWGILSRPYGTGRGGNVYPRTDVLGYFQPSLRDWFRYTLISGLFSASAVLLANRGV